MYLTTERLKHWGTGIAVQTILTFITGMIYAMLTALTSDLVGGAISSLIYVAVTTHALGYTGQRLAEYQHNREETQTEPAEQDIEPSQTEPEESEPQTEQMEAEEEEEETEEESLDEMLE